MHSFQLPKNTAVGRVIPKNAFDDNINSRQKKQFTDLVQRITWTNKLSSQTTNLRSVDVEEIQIFVIELKKRDTIDEILKIINKHIPYHIICWIEYAEEVFVSAAHKHKHVTNDDISVIDWIYSSKWFTYEESSFTINLKDSLDEVLNDFCAQITGRNDLKGKNASFMIQNQVELDKVNKKILSIRKQLKKSKQFNEKVELNLQLRHLEQSLFALKGKNNEK